MYTVKVGYGYVFKLWFAYDFSYVSVTFFLTYFCCIGSTEEIQKGKLTVEKLLLFFFRHKKSFFLMDKNFFSVLFILLYNIVFVLPYFDMNPPWVYVCSPSWTPLLPPSPSHPSWSSQCTSPEHPVSCIEPGLAIHFTYDNIHVSMPFSKIIPPSPSPTESKSLILL